MSNSFDMMLQFDDEDDDDNFLTHNLHIPLSHSIPIENENLDLPPSPHIPLSLSLSPLNPESAFNINTNLDSTCASTHDSESTCTVSPILDQDLNDIGNMDVAIDTIDDSNSNDFPRAPLDQYPLNRPRPDNVISSVHNVMPTDQLLDPSRIQSESKSHCHSLPIIENQAHACDQPIPIPIEPIQPTYTIPITTYTIQPGPTPLVTPIQPNTSPMPTLKCQHTCTPLCPERESNTIFESKFQLSRHHTDRQAHPHHASIKSAPRNLQRAIHTNKTISSTECRKCLSITRKKNNSKKKKNSTTLNSENKTNTIASD